MKRVEIDKLINESSNEIQTGLLKSVPDVRFVFKIDEALEKRGLTQAKLATLTGLRPTTISELVKGTRFAITKSHIASIMIALRITDIREIIDIEFTPETVEKFEEQSEKWLADGVVPDEVINLYAENAKAIFNPNIMD